MNQIKRKSTWLCSIVKAFQVAYQWAMNLMRAVECVFLVGYM